MALKAVHVSDVPYLDQVTENVTLSLLSSRFNKGVNDEVSDDTKKRLEFPKFVVMGHRGSGMNMLQSSDQRMKSIKENSILSFNAATQFPIDFIEFDVQVKTLNHSNKTPVIFRQAKQFSFSTTLLLSVFFEVSGVIWGWVQFMWESHVGPSREVEETTVLAAPLSPFAAKLSLFAGFKAYGFAGWIWVGSFVFRKARPMSAL